MSQLEQLTTWDAAWKRLAPRQESITELFKHLNDCRLHTDHDLYYAPYINILQSSGTGKSHTMSRLSTETSAPGFRRTSLFYLCVRHGDELGFPLPDRSLRDFLRGDVEGSFVEAYHDWRERESQRLINVTYFISIVSDMEMSSGNATGAATVNDEMRERYRARIRAEPKDKNLPSESGFPPALVCWWHLRAVCLLHAMFLFCEYFEPFHT